MNKCRPSQKGHSINSLKLHPYFKFYKLHILVFYMSMFTRKMDQKHMLLFEMLLGSNVVVVGNENMFVFKE